MIIILHCHFDENIRLERTYWQEANLRMEVWKINWFRYLTASVILQVSGVLLFSPFNFLFLILQLMIYRGIYLKWGSDSQNANQHVVLWHYLEPMGFRDLPQKQKDLFPFCFHPHHWKIAGGWDPWSTKIFRTRTYTFHGQYHGCWWQWTVHHQSWWVMVFSCFLEYSGPYTSSGCCCCCC